MSNDDVCRIHKRIDSLDVEQERRHGELAERLLEIQTMVTEVATGCKICRPIVLGNGGDSIDRRVARLETATSLSGKWLWLVAGAAATIVASIVAAVTTAALIGR